MTNAYLSGVRKMNRAPWWKEVAVTLLPVVDGYRFEEWHTWSDVTGAFRGKALVLRLKHVVFDPVSQERRLHYETGSIEDRPPAIVAVRSGIGRPAPLLYVGPGEIDITRATMLTLRVNGHFHHANWRKS